VKSQKIYIVTSDNEIVGIWSNLSKLVSHFQTLSISVPYHKINRKVKLIQSDNTDTLKNFFFEFSDDNSKIYQLKVELLQ
jgi:hypothetical protein